jgi:hypothetical protein
MDGRQAGFFSPFCLLKGRTAREKGRKHCCGVFTLMDDEELIAATVPSERYAVIPNVGVVNLGAMDSAYTQQVVADRRSKKKPKRRKPSLYDLYHEHEEEAEDDEDGVDIDLDEAATMYNPSLMSTSASMSNNAGAADALLYEFTTFEIGMDINILLNQVHQNILRSICIDDTDNTGRFTDGDLICLAASLRHNRSLLSLQLRYLPVTDISLVPLCKSLEQHPTLRALDLSGTKGTRKTGEALRRLACVNTHLLHVMREDTMFQERDLAVMEEALQYNAMMCADPRSNPYDVKMISKVTEEERAKRLLDAQLNYNPWLHGPPPSSVLADGSFRTDDVSARKKAGRKGVTFASATAADDDTADSFLSQRVCGDYIRGACRYGSRCKYYHPPWTPALEQVAQLQKYNAEEEMKRKWDSLRSDGAGGASIGAASSAGAHSEGTADARSVRWEDCSFGGGVSVAPSSLRSLGGSSTRRPRRRETEFTLDARRVHAAYSGTEEGGNPMDDEEVARAAAARRRTVKQRQRRKRLLLLSTVVCCACTCLLATAAGAVRPKSVKHR